MSPLLHRVKETIERLAGRHLIFSRQPPFVHAERRFLLLRTDLHNKCNLRCRMCYFATDEVWNQPLVEMSDSLIDRMERELWPVTHELWLSCATEPLIGRKLESTLARAKRAGIPQVSLVTNALALTEERARMLIGVGLDRLHVSFDGATAATYEAIRQPARFERVLGNVRRLVELRQAAGASRPALSLGVVMMVENMMEWAGLVHLAADLGADEVLFRPQVYYTEMAHTRHFWDDPPRFNEALAALREAARQRAIAATVPGGFAAAPAVEGSPAAPAPPPAPPAPGHCLTPWFQLVLYPNGDLIPCAQLYGKCSLGNLNEQSFGAIFYGPAMRRLREELRSGRPRPACLDCGAAAARFDETAAHKFQRSIWS